MCAFVVIQALALSLHLTMVDMLGIRGVCSCRYKVSDVKICITIIQLVALHIFISKSECDFFFFCESKPSTVISITSYLFWLRTFRWPRHWFVMYRKVQQNAIFALNKTFLFVSNPRVYNSAEIGSNGFWCHHHERQRKKMDGGDEDFLYLTFKSLITRDCSHTVWILFCVSGTRIWFLVVLDVFVCSGGQSSRCKWHSQGFSHHQQKFIKLFICSRWDCPPNFCCASVKVMRLDQHNTHSTKVSSKLKSLIKWAIARKKTSTLLT